LRLPIEEVRAVDGDARAARDLPRGYDVIGIRERQLADEDGARQECGLPRPSLQQSPTDANASRAAPAVYLEQRTK